MVFSGHLRQAKVHSQLSRHYWWPEMRSDIDSWFCACIKCARRSVGHLSRPRLTPIAVGGPFDQVGVDVLQLTKTKRGNRYLVVFMDYLKKWPEVYATADQTAPTIVRLLVKELISQHRVPTQVLSDRGPLFLSKRILSVCKVMGVKKVNTSAYYPQSDGLVERFNCTPTDMLAKSISPGIYEWDERLPFVLFSYRVSMQSSTMETPFFILHGRDPLLPTEAILSLPVDRRIIDLDDYKSTMMLCLESGTRSSSQSTETAEATEDE